MARRGCKARKGGDGGGGQASMRRQPGHPAPGPGHGQGAAAAGGGCGCVCVCPAPPRGADHGMDEEKKYLFFVWLMRGPRPAWPPHTKAKRALPSTNNSKRKAPSLATHAQACAGHDPGLLRSKEDSEGEAPSSSIASCLISSCPLHPRHPQPRMPITRGRSPRPSS